MKKLYRVKFFYIVNVFDKDLTAPVGEIKEYNELWELQPYKSTESILDFVRKNHNVVGDISIREEWGE